MHQLNPFSDEPYIEPPELLYNTIIQLSSLGRTIDYVGYPLPIERDTQPKARHERDNPPSFQDITQSLDAILTTVDRIPIDHVPQSRICDAAQSLATFIQETDQGDTSYPLFDNRSLFGNRSLQRSSVATEIDCPYTGLDDILFQRAYGQMNSILDKFYGSNTEITTVATQCKTDNRLRGLFQHDRYYAAALLLCLTKCYEGLAADNGLGQLGGVPYSEQVIRTNVTNVSPATEGEEESKSYDVSLPRLSGVHVPQPLVEENRDATDSKEPVKLSRRERIREQFKIDKARIREEQKERARLAQEEVLRTSALLQKFQKEEKVIEWHRDEDGRLWVVCDESPEARAYRMSQPSLRAGVHVPEPLVEENGDATDNTIS